MGKHPIGGMRSMIVPNRKADMRFRKKAYLRNKERMEEESQKKGGLRKMRLVDVDYVKELWQGDNPTSVTMRRIFGGLPTVDAAPVRHGKWINRVDTDTDMHECSVCGARVVKGLYEYDNPNNYCYHCGAKMDL